MLICIGGFSGSGRKTLAKHLAIELGYHHYDMDNRKFRRSTLTPKGVVESVQHPITDEQRAFLYRCVAEDLPRLSKMYQDIVIDNLFHRAVPRNEFFRLARHHFRSMLFVWITHDTDAPVANLQKEVRRSQQTEDFQPFDTPIPTFTYTGSTENAEDAFVEFIRAQISASRSNLKPNA